jgi:hypothetical protein
MKHKSIFWPLTLVAAGVVWLLVSMRIVPASNLLALVYLFPYLLMALGIGLILRSRWQLAGVIVPALAVTAALAAIVFAPQLGWTTVPVFAGEPGFGGGIPGSGKMSVETREVGEFTRIKVNYPAEVIILQGKTESVKIEADDNLLPQLSTDVKGETLLIQNDVKGWERRVEPSEYIKLTITVRDLQGLDFAAAGAVRLESLEVEGLEIELNGAGEIQIIDLQAQNLTARLDGVGSITASGKAKFVSVDVNGLGSFLGEELDSAKADATVDGMGSANLQVREHLTATINGMGSIGYLGSPEVTRRMNGAGSVTPLGN